MNPQVEPMPAEGDFLARLGRLEWPRWAVVVFPPIFVAAFGFACVILTNQTILPTALAFAAAGGLGLVAGFAARRALRRRADLTRALVALAGLTIGLLLLGILTWGGAGVGPFGLAAPGPNWTGLAQLLLAFGSAWLALRAWRPAAPPARISEPTPPAIPTEAQAPTPQGEAPRRMLGATRERAWAGWRWLRGQTSRASRWAAGAFPARMRARRVREAAINEAAGSGPAVSNRDGRGQAVGRANHAPATSGRGAEEQNMLQHLARPWQAVRERVTAAWQSRFRGGNWAGGRGRVHLPGSTPAPPVNLRRSLRRRGRVRFTGAAADYCPFCLELVARDDPRGVVVCPVCRTRHHADCWAVTGMCQVPHQHS